MPRSRARGPLRRAAADIAAGFARARAEPSIAERFRQSSRTAAMSPSTNGSSAPAGEPRRPAVHDAGGSAECAG